MTNDTFEPKIVGFLCNWCSYRAADLAGSARIKYAPNVRIIRVMCSGRVDPTFVFKALADGADGVMVAGCHPGECHYIEQNYKAMRRFAMMQHTLTAMGVEPDRVQLVWASAAEGQRLADAIDKLVADVRRLGPLKWPANWNENGERLEGVGRNRQRTRRGDGGARMSSNGKKPKGKLAIYWAASCGGCEISILAIDEKILNVAEAFDIVMWPCATDGKVRDVEKMPDQSIDVCLFNGGIRTSEQEYMAQLMRRKSKVLVAFGSCASEGCIPGLANMNSRQEVFDTVYKEGSSTVPENPQDVRPQPETKMPEGTLHLPIFYDTLKTLDQTVDVDYYLPGCPPEAENIWTARGGDPGRQAAAEGLGDRPEHDRLRRVPAEARREEDQKVLPHLADGSRRGDVLVGAGAFVLRHRHPGGLQGALPGGQLALHRLPRGQRRRGRLRRPADERRGLGDRQQRPGRDRPDHFRRHSRSGGQFLSL